MKMKGGEEEMRKVTDQRGPQPADDGGKHLVQELTFFLILLLLYFYQLLIFLF